MAAMETDNEPRKVYIVTGASRYIGLFAASHLVDQGHNVVIVARDVGAMQAWVHLNDEFNQARYMKADFSKGNDELAPKIIEYALKQFGRLDGLVINHGSIAVSRIENIDFDVFRRELETNYISYVALAKAAIPALKETKGTIVMTSSGAARKGMVAWEGYGAAKASINHLVYTLANEQPDITTLAIEPGRVDTAMMRNMIMDTNNDMDPRDRDEFIRMRQNNELLCSETPAGIIARVVTRAPKELSGKIFRYNDEEINKLTGRFRHGNQNT